MKDLFYYLIEVVLMLAGFFATATVVGMMLKLIPLWVSVVAVIAIVSTVIGWNI